MASMFIVQHACSMPTIPIILSTKLHLVESANYQASHYICTTRSIILSVFPFTFKFSPIGLAEEKVFVMEFKL